MGYRWTLTNLADSSTEVLTKDPIGWEDMTFTIARDAEYMGAFQNIGASLKFHCDGGGKEFIDAVYEANDIDGRISILVEYDCDGSGTYGELFTGILNLARYSTDGVYTTVNIEKSDLLTKLKSRDDISVSLETTTSIGGDTISSIATDTIQLTPVMLNYETEWVVAQDYAFSRLEAFTGLGKLGFITPAGSVGRTDLNNAYPFQEFSSVSEDGGLPFQRAGVPPILTLSMDETEMPITLDYEINWKGTFTDNQTVGGSSRTATIFKLILYYGNAEPGQTASTIELYSSTYSADPFSLNFDINATGQITLSAGQSIWIAWVFEYTFTGNCTLALDFVYDRSTFKVSGKTSYKETACKSVMVHEAFSQVVDAIADSNNNFYSEFYGRTDSRKQSYGDDGCGSLLAITNGLNIREFSDKPILCSLSDLFKSCNALHNIGLAEINGKIRVEPISYFFNPASKIITLPYVNSYEQRNENRYYYNKIDIGYQKWEADFNGGLDEPCGKHEYSTAISSAKTTYSKLSKYLASSYAIELTRRKNKDIAPTVDYKYDNENFFIAVERGAYVYADNFLPEMFSDAFNTGSGMIAIDSAYNLRLTPKRMLLAHFGAIAAGIQKIHGNVTFVTGTGNTDLVTQKFNVGCPEDYNGAVIGENDDVAWNDSNVANVDPLWLPEVYTFDYPLTYSEFNTIKANPYGYIEFYKTLGDSKYGYIMSMEYRLKTGLTRFTLLRANI